MTISAILDELENMAIAGYDYPVYRNTSLLSSITIAHTPCRVLSILNVSGNNLQRLTLGSNSVLKARWAVQDKVIFRQAGLGTGLNDIAQEIELYITAYYNAVRATFTGNNFYTVYELVIQPQMIEWPAESGTKYHGMATTLYIDDIIQ